MPFPGPAFVARRIFRRTRTARRMASTAKAATMVASRVDRKFAVLRPPVELSSSARGGACREALACGMAAMTAVSSRPKVPNRPGLGALLVAAGSVPAGLLAGAARARRALSPEFVGHRFLHGFDKGVELLLRERLRRRRRCLGETGGDQSQQEGETH